MQVRAFCAWSCYIGYADYQPRKIIIFFFKGKAFFLLNPVEGAFFNKL